MYDPDENSQKERDESTYHEFDIKTIKDTYLGLKIKMEA
jgi:hypothetical protein